MDFTKARTYIQERLRSELSNQLHYHGYHHTLDVVIASQKIGGLEGVSEKELTLLQTAAWYHDSGFLLGYQGHEELGCQIAEQQIAQCDYSPEEIQRVKDMIMATKVPQQPKDSLGEILCDADLEYLGGDNYYSVAESLRKELWERQIISDHRAWVEMQIQFLKNHHYFTKSAKERYAANKKARLAELESQLMEMDANPS